MKNVSVSQLKYHWRVYLFVVPSLCLLLTFAYFPAMGAIYYSFFNWDGGFVKEFIGFGNYVRALGDPYVRHGYYVVAILVFANLFKMIPSIAAAVVIHRLKSTRSGYFYRVLFVIPMIIPGIVMILIWKYFFDPNFGILNEFLEFTGLMDALIALDGAFGWGVFLADSAPAWLSRPELIIPALIIWGFPWVGTIGVLIYLSGLSGISDDIYDAAKVDGAGPLRTFFSVELPLILTQVRINLILMIIGTIKEYGLTLVLLGHTGGPGGVGLVPGLYMFRRAFYDKETEMGYACSLGIIMFLIILALTFVNQKFVRVDK
ncbi:MAG: sugar ABC transporter permease [Verrucomicrobia bacterium]|nr:MAG: sugar ABC transporter permease [Verrucomicrobiota bacterium]